MTDTDQAPPPTAKKAPVKRKPAIVTIEALCKELKIVPRKARKMLREVDRKKYPALAKAHKAHYRWEFAKGSDALREAKALLKSR